MKSSKKLAIGLVAIVAAFSLAVMPVFAQTDTSTTNTLGTAAILGSMNNGSSLGDLFVLDKLFGGNSSVLNGGNKTGLGDLFILNQLFSSNSLIGSGGVLSNSSGKSLGDLFVLDRLFGNNSSVLSSGGSNTNLGDLYILDQLFK